MPLIVSALPGRIRVRDPRLRQLARLECLRTCLAQLPGVASIELGGRTGSLLLHYDPQLIDSETLEAQVEHATLAALKVRASPARSGLMQANRWAKLGMLASLSGSLALLALGNKRGHGLAGGLFVAGLGLHLLVHRRHLLR
ncbi:MAG: hypothetical protein KAX90_01250 [Pseudomonas sp.]|nr:hypothetical protein [Pseudomonas sp.]